MRFGNDGLAFPKPDENGGLNQGGESGNGEAEVVYDPLPEIDDNKVKHQKP